MVISELSDVTASGSDISDAEIDPPIPPIEASFMEFSSSAKLQRFFSLSTIEMEGMPFEDSKQQQQQESSPLLVANRANKIDTSHNADKNNEASREIDGSGIVSRPISRPMSPIIKAKGGADNISPPRFSTASLSIREARARISQNSRPPSSAANTWSLRNSTSALTTTDVVSVIEEDDKTTEAGKKIIKRDSNEQFLAPPPAYGLNESPTNSLVASKTSGTTSADIDSRDSGDSKDDAACDV